MSFRRPVQAALPGNIQCSVVVVALFLLSPTAVVNAEDFPPQEGVNEVMVSSSDHGVNLENPTQAQPLGERVIEGTIPWRLLAEEATPSLPSSRADESLRVPIKESFRVEYALRDVKDTTLVQVMIQADHPPTGMAFDMSVRAGNDTWPLGPVAWVKGEIGWWAYDTDLPEDIKDVDVILTPSTMAAGRLRRDNRYRLIRLNQIWDGAPVVLPKIRIGSQEISMCKIAPPSREAAREYAMEQFEQADPVVRELKADGDWRGARAELQRRAQQLPDDAVALYDLGCIALADGDLSVAMKSFSEVGRLNVPEPLRRRTQRQLRRICARYLYQANGRDPGAMCALGTAYERGWGVKQIFQDAKRWYRSAGNAGNVEAMCRLAALYEHETGATVHTEKAHEWYRSQTLEWYRKAANLGNQEAEQWLSTHHLN